MQRFIMTATVLFGLALGLFVTGGASVSAGSDLGNDGIDFDCPDFANAANPLQAANDYFIGDGGSLARNVDLLDGSPRNGIACDGVFGPGGGGVDPTATATSAAPTATATTAPVTPTATAVGPTATLAPGEPTAVPTDAPIDPTAAPVDPTQAPVDQSTQVPVVVDNGGTDAGTGTGAISGTTTGTSSSTTTGVSLPNTGTGDSQSSSLTTMTLLLALFAGACLALGGYGLLRGRRG